MKLRRTPAHLRPDHRQLDTERAQWHDWVDLIFDFWPQAERMAKDMGMGYPAIGGGVGRSGASHVETLAVALADGQAPTDPGLLAADWLAHLHETRAHLKTLDRERLRLTPHQPENGRANTVEVCPECSMPAPRGKRLDGVLYHSEKGHQCWMAAYRRTRARTTPKPMTPETCTCCGGLQGDYDQAGEWVPCPACQAA